MNDRQIDLLIRARNNITDRVEADEYDQHTDEIDALLREVPPGQRNDVDLLLGRMCAVLPQRNTAAVKWSSDEQRAKWQAEGTLDLAWLAYDKVNEYRNWQACRGDLAI